MRDCMLSSCCFSFYFKMYQM